MANLFQKLIEKNRESITSVLMFLIGIPILVLGYMVFIMPIFQQIMSWLKHGVIPERDLFWFIAEPKCYNTGWVAQGWKGMDLCRVENINFTGWVGVDKIINFIFDIHISILGLITLVVLFTVWVVIEEKLP